MAVGDIWPSTSNLFHRSNLRHPSRPRLIDILSQDRKPLIWAGVQISVMVYLLHEKYFTDSGHCHTLLRSVITSYSSRRPSRCLLTTSPPAE